MFCDVGYETVDFREGLIAGVAVVMVFSFELAEGPAAAKFGAVEGVAAG